MEAQWRKNFTEEQQNKTQKRDRNGWRNTEMGHLAEPAVWFVVAAGVRVRHNLQQEEKRYERQREGDTRGQTATWPDIYGPHSVAYKQEIDPSEEPSREARITR